MINSRKITDLNPIVAHKCRQFITQCQELGYDVVITSTLRDNEAQAKLYAQGRETAGPIVTHAKPGTSYHNYGLAFDFVPIKNGKADWANTVAFRKCAEIGKQLGLEWGGDWVSFKEMAHLQYTGGKTIGYYRDQTEADSAKQPQLSQ